MATVTLRSRSGSDAGTVELADDVFGIEPNVSVMHQVVTAQLAAKRSGTQSTRTRAEVAGGGVKPFKQKGTGRARAGSIRSPLWRGGGVALGPKPRSYAQRTPKKMKRLALRSALSDRAAEDKVVVVDAWDFDVPRTRDAREALAALGVEGRALVVLGEGDELAWRSFRNLPTVHVISVAELNTYDVLVSDYVVFTAETLPTAIPVRTDAEPGATDAAPSSAPAPTAAPAEDAPAEEVPAEAAPAGTGPDLTAGHFDAAPTEEEA
jgi:large subunit ribosomal protein L4